jgi:hypothetical protein
LKGWVKVKVKVRVGESGKGNGKVKGGHNVLPVNLLPYLAEAYPWSMNDQQDPINKTLFHFA